MKLSKVIKILSELDESCSKKAYATRLNIKKVILECEDDIVLTLGKNNADGQAAKD